MAAAAVSVNHLALQHQPVDARKHTRFLVSSHFFTADALLSRLKSGRIFACFAFHDTNLWAFLPWRCIGHLRLAGLLSLEMVRELDHLLLLYWDQTGKREERAFGKGIMHWDWPTPMS